MEAIGISETSVYLYETTRRNLPEGCHLDANLFELDKWDVRAFDDPTCTVNTNSLNKRGKLFLSRVRVFSMFILCYVAYFINLELIYCR
jgi:hypothetical protein